MTVTGGRKRNKTQEDEKGGIQHLKKDKKRKKKIASREKLNQINLAGRKGEYNIQEEREKGTTATGKARDYVYKKLRRKWKVMCELLYKRGGDSLSLKTEFTHGNCVNNFSFINHKKQISVAEVICMIIVYGIKAGNDCPAIKFPSSQGTVSPRAVVSIRELNKYLKNQKSIEAFQTT